MGETKDFSDYVVAVFCEQHFMHYICTISFYAIQKKIVIYSCHLMQTYKMFRAKSAFVFFQFDKNGKPGWILMKWGYATLLLRTKSCIDLSWSHCIVYQNKRYLTPNYVNCPFRDLFSNSLSTEIQPTSAYYHHFSLR